MSMHHSMGCLYQEIVDQTGQMALFFQNQWWSVMVRIMVVRVVDRLLSTRGDNMSQSTALLLRPGLSKVAKVRPRIYALGTGIALTAHESGCE